MKDFDVYHAFISDHFRSDRDEAAIDADYDRLQGMIRRSTAAGRMTENEATQLRSYADSMMIHSTFGRKVF